MLLAVGAGRVVMWGLLRSGRGGLWEIRRQVATPDVNGRGSETHTHTLHCGSEPICEVYVCVFCIFPQGSLQLSAVFYAHPTFLMENSDNK